MATETIDLVLNVCKTIKHQRTIETITTHMLGEVSELCDEVKKIDTGEPFGDDGILGEACDVMLTLIDLVYMHNPDITVEDFKKTMARKSAKWVAVYGTDTLSDVSPDVLGWMISAHQASPTHDPVYGVLAQRSKECK